MRAGHAAYAPGSPPLSGQIVVGRARPNARFTFRRPPAGWAFVADF
ncbi:hypothetical protein OH687_10780 [Burkholderia anthina]|nr:hypothetical protein OH687_10780 [Burkholderia anthina]